MADAPSARLLAFGDMGKAPSAWDGSLEHSWDNGGRGELGSWNTSRMLSAQAAIAQTDAVLHIGDISYAVGYGAEWDEFMTQVEPLSARVPWMVQDGNHERNCPCNSVTPRERAAGIDWFAGSDSGGECGVPYDRRFSMPRDAAGVAQPWYLLTVGPIAVVLMSTERDFTLGSAQLTALEELLRSVNRTAHPWLLFGGHRPMYADVTFRVPSAAPLQSLVEPLLLRYKVDVALWGHHHSYQRSCPMAKGACTPSGGVTHVVVGTAGYEFSEVAPADQRHAWAAFVNNTQYGFGAINATRNEFHFAFVRSDGGGVMDEFRLLAAPPS